MIKSNINNEAIIYPSKKGWDKIYEIIQKEYNMPSLQEAIEYVNKYRRTKDNGYKEQLWEIMSTLGELFYNGSNALKNTTIIIEETC